MLEKLFNIRIKNTIQPYHWHDTMEIDLVLQGDIDIVTNNKKHNIPSGELFLCNIGVAHCIDRVSEKALFVQMEFNMHEFERYIPKVANIYFSCGPEATDTVSVEIKKEIRNYMIEICHLLGNKINSDDKEQTALYCCIEIINDLKFTFKGGDTDRQRFVSEKMDDCMWELIDYMYDNSFRKLTLKDSADHIHLSGSHLSRLLKRYIGLSYSEFLAFVRAENSIADLLNTEKTITEISYESGFSAPRYYTKAFREFFGCTPAEFRKQNKAFFKPEKSLPFQGLQFDDGVSEREFDKYLKEFGRLHEETYGNSLKFEFDIDSALFALPMWDHDDPLLTAAIPLVFTNGVYTEAFYLNQALMKIGDPAYHPQKNVVVWEDNASRHIFLFNPDAEKLHCNVKFSNLNKEITYLLATDGYKQEVNPNADSILALPGSTIKSIPLLINAFRPQEISEFISGISDFEENIYLSQYQYIHLALLPLK